MEQIYRARASAIPGPGRDAGKGPGRSWHVSEKRSKMTRYKGAPPVEPEDNNEVEIPEQNLNLGVVCSQNVHGCRDQ